MVSAQREREREGGREKEREKESKRTKESRAVPGPSEQKTFERGHQKSPSFFVYIIYLVLLHERHF